MVKKLLERAIEIEGLIRIIRDGNPLPETYTLLSNKAVELAEEAMLLEERTVAMESEEPSEVETAQSGLQPEEKSDKPEEVKDQEPNEAEENPDNHNLAEIEKKAEVPTIEITVESENLEEALINNIEKECTPTAGEKEADKGEEAERKEEAPKEVSMIDMTGNTEKQDDKNDLETPHAQHPIVISMDKEETSNKQDSQEDLSESEEDIEDLPEEEKTTPIETDTSKVTETYEEAAEEEDDILLNLEEDDEAPEETQDESKQECKQPIEIKGKEESSGFDIKKKEEAEPDVEIKKEGTEQTKKIEEKAKTAFTRQKKLKSAFSLNDRFMFARELFEGNMKMFDSTLDFIEGIEYYSIIEDYFYNELEWDPENEAVASFMEILRPQFKE